MLTPDSRTFIIFTALYSETSPQVDIADRVNASYPIHFLTLMHQRVIKDIAAADQYAPSHTVPIIYKWKKRR